MKRYRIYLENTGRKAIADTVSKYFQGFTVFETSGYYKGKAERSLCVEILDDSNKAHVVGFLAQVLRQAGNQESVLLVAESVQAEFVS